MTQQDKIDKAIREKNARIDKAISGKERSIAFWAAMNNAVNYARDKSLENVFKVHKEIYDYWVKWNTPQPIEDPLKVNMEFEEKMEEDKREELADEANRQAAEAVKQGFPVNIDDDDIPVIEE